jgi:hypothetical protein
MGHASMAGARGDGAVTHRVILTNAFSRERFKRIVDKAPDGYVAEVREPKRTLDQNNKLWAMLTDVSVAMPMGRRHTPDDWKAISSRHLETNMACAGAKRRRIKRHEACDYRKPVCGRY